MNTGPALDEKVPVLKTGEGCGAMKSDIAFEAADAARCAPFLLLACGNPFVTKL